jgi:hypothetical protein
MAKRRKKPSARQEVESLLKRAGKLKLDRCDSRYLKEMAAWLREQVEYVEDNDANIELARETVKRTLRIMTLNLEQRKLRQANVRDGMRTLEKFLKRRA